MEFGSSSEDIVQPIYLQLNSEKFFEIALNGNSKHPQSSLISTEQTFQVFFSQGALEGRQGVSQDVEKFVETKQSLGKNLNFNF